MVAHVLSTLLVSIFKRALQSVSLGRGGDLVSSARLSALGNIVESARVPFGKGTLAIHRLGASSGEALLLSVLVLALGSAMGGLAVDNVELALLVDLHGIIVVAWARRLPVADARLWLVAAILGARPGTLWHWALLAIVGSWSRNNNLLAASLFHCSHVQEAVVLTVWHVNVLPLPLAIRWLGTVRGGTGLVSILVCALETTILSFLGHDKSRALAVGGLGSVVGATFVLNKGANTGNRLGTSLLSANLHTVFVRAQLSTVFWSGNNLDSLALLVDNGTVETSHSHRIPIVIWVIFSPNPRRSVNPVGFAWRGINKLILAVHWLGASSLCALGLSTDVRAHLTTIGSLRGDCVLSALLNGVGERVITALSEIVPSANAVIRLSAVLGGALLIGVREWARLATVLGVDKDAGIGTHLALSIGDLAWTWSQLIYVGGLAWDLWFAEPSKDAVNRLIATALGALLLTLGVWALSATIGSGLGNYILSAPLVVGNVRLLVKEAGLILAPRALAVHRLVTALVGALRVSVRVWALLTIVIRNGGDVELCAALVGLRRGLELAASVGAPLPLAIDWLSAASWGARLLVVLIAARLSTVLGFLGDLELSATHVGISDILVGALSVGSSHTHAVHRLFATVGGALELTADGVTNLSIVGRVDQNLSFLAPPVDISLGIVEASSVWGARTCLSRAATSGVGLLQPLVSGWVIWAPGNLAINRLCATLGLALLLVVGKWAHESSVGRSHADLVLSAHLRGVVHWVVLALLEWRPSADTVHRLVAALLSALFMASWVWASISVVLWLISHNNLLAFLGHSQDWVDHASVVRLIPAVDLVSEWIVGVQVWIHEDELPVVLAVDWLNAASNKALLSSIRVWALLSTSFGFRGVGIHSAPVVGVAAICVVLAGGEVSPNTSTVHWLRTALRVASLVPIGIRTNLAIVAGFLGDLHFLALHVLLRGRVVLAVFR